MVKLRLTRTGATNDVCYRVVAADTRRARESRFIENLGWYDPKRQGLNFSLDLDRVAHWKAHGAQLSDTVRSLVRRAQAAASRETPVTDVPVEAGAVDEASSED